jgi:hypothetical protein
VVTNTRQEKRHSETPPESNLMSDSRLDRVAHYARLEAELNDLHALDGRAGRLLLAERHAEKIEELAAFLGSAPELARFLALPALTRREGWPFFRRHTPVHVLASERGSMLQPWCWRFRILFLEGSSVFEGTVDLDMLQQLRFDLSKPTQFRADDHVGVERIRRVRLFEVERWLGGTEAEHEPLQAALERFETALTTAEGAWKMSLAERTLQLEHERATLLCPPAFPSPERA